MSRGISANKADFFVIAAYVTENGKRVKNLIKHFCGSRNISELKNRDLNFAGRQTLLRLLNAETDHYFSYVCLDKAQLRDKRLFRDKNVLFNYLTGFLLKPIIARHQESDVTILFDNRTLKVTSVRSLPDYIKSKMYGDWSFEGNVDIHYVNSKDVRLIQAADLGAGICLEKYKLGKDHFYGMLRIRDSIRFPYDGFGKDSASS